MTAKTIGDLTAVGSLTDATEYAVEQGTSFKSTHSQLRTYLGLGDNSVTFTDTATPSTPAANAMELYAKDVDGRSDLFAINSDGTEVNLCNQFNDPTLSAQPTLATNHSSVANAITGDYSKLSNAFFKTITGAATATQPATGYFNAREVGLFYGFMDNSSGHNQETDGADGRTGIPVFAARILQKGNGDAPCFNGTAIVTGTKAGATHYLASPAAQIINGTLEGGVAGAAMQNEISITDGGFDCHGIGMVYSLTRSVSTSTLSEWWAGTRIQSKGAEDVDVGVSLFGPIGVGFDAAPATLSGPAVSLKADQTISFNATASTDAGGVTRFSDGQLTNTTIGYNSGNSALEITVNDSVRQRIGSNLTAFGVNNGTYSLTHVDTDQLLRIAGGATGITGGHIGLYGNAHGGRAGDWFLASNNTEIIDYDLDDDEVTFHKPLVMNAQNIQIDDNQGIVDGNGNEVLWFQTITSAVNYLEMQGSATGNAVQLTSQGADANVNMIFNAKGASSIFLLRTNGTTRASVDSNGITLASGTSLIMGSGGPEVLSGTGTPEAAVTADVGSIFMRTDGGASTSIYIKESGTGNTGWVAK